MIKDDLRNAKLYKNISDNLKRGLEWLEVQDLKTLELGVHCIDGQDLYVNVQEYQTKENAKYEAHQKYIDIQYVITGEEQVGVCDIKNCKTCTSYEKETDVEFLDCLKNETMLPLREGEFLVLFPNDAHKPSITPDNLSKDVENIVRKAVVKVAVN